MPNFKQVARLTWLSIVLILWVTQGARAANECWGLRQVDSFNSEPFPTLKAGKIVGNGAAFFEEGGSQCASSSAPVCRKSNKLHLLPGDTVVVMATIPGYLCVQYANLPQQKYYEYYGWVPARRVKIYDPSKMKVSLDSWLGTWRNGSTTIVLSRQGRRLLVYGDAAKQVLATTNFGQIKDRSIPVGNTLDVGEGDPKFNCYAKFLKIRNMLFAVDNYGCGGQDVTFTGIYARK
ncbi:hypothetical protein [Acidocella facilis]|uniref:hypothetical protein n=1 Tax=Acidocella facilis TaxID=525 RepID=UPI001F46DC08|nr:hypothetical protein [Acidocella facilis]